MERFGSERLSGHIRTLRSFAGLAGAVDIVAGSPHVDVEHLDGVVPVAKAVPGWNAGLHIAGGVGRTGAQ
jgi:hypothetical protein